MRSQLDAASRNHKRIHNTYNLPAVIQPGSREDQIQRLHALQSQAQAERYQARPQGGQCSCICICQSGSEQCNEWSSACLRLAAHPLRSARPDLQLSPLCNVPQLASALLLAPCTGLA